MFHHVRLIVHGRVRLIIHGGGSLPEVEIGHHVRLKQH